MTDIESARTGYTKLYHPRGPLVSLPVVGDTPAAMFAYVTAMLDAGFVVAAPGMEVGEEREMVGAVLRSSFEREGEVTDTILLYTADEGMKYSFLKLYLNDDAGAESFEKACGVKLDSLPIYEGTNKPERDGTALSRKYIVKLARPVPVVFKKNPKWIQEEYDAAKAANKVYKKPSRVFVRWVDAPPPTPPGPPGDGTPPLTDMQVAESAWKMRLEKVLAIDDINKLLPLVKAITDPPIRARVWTMCRDFATAKHWMLDVGAGVFRHAAEMPIPKTVEAVQKLVTPAPSDPPPPDEPTVSPLIAAWQERLDPDTVNESKLNGEIMTQFRTIAKNEPERGAVWLMIRTFAEKWGYLYDQNTMRFLERMP